MNVFWSGLVTERAARQENFFRVFYPRTSPRHCLVLVAHITRDPRLVELTDEQRQAVTELVERIGLVAAAKQLSLGKNAVLNIMARGLVMPGTAALLRESLNRRGGIVA